jgi:small subunit ribosomal protein S21
LHCRDESVVDKTLIPTTRGVIVAPASWSSKISHSQLRRLFVVKLRLRDNENINDAVKRFRKLVEHAGIKKEMRRREYYEKPSDEKRRARRRAERRNKLQRLSGGV